MNHKILVLTWALAIGPLCSAAPLVFQDHNCSIEFPATWRMVNPLPARTLTAASSADSHKSISLVAMSVREADLPNAQRQMNDGIKKAFTAAGLQIIERHFISHSLLKNTEWRIGDLLHGFGRTRAILSASFLWNGGCPI